MALSWASNFASQAGFLMPDGVDCGNSCGPQLLRGLNEDRESSTLMSNLFPLNLSSAKGLRDQETVLLCGRPFFGTNHREIAWKGKRSSSLKLPFQYSLRCSRVLCRNEPRRPHNLRTTRNVHGLETRLFGNGGLSVERHTTRATSNLFSGSRQGSEDDDDCSRADDEIYRDKPSSRGVAAQDVAEAVAADQGVAPAQAGVNRPRTKLGDSLPPESLILFFSCIIGLLVGAGVVTFNYLVHEIHDLAWEGVPDSGAAWLRAQPLQDTWQHLLFVPVGGGLAVGLLNFVRTQLESSADAEQATGGKRTFLSDAKAVGVPTLKAVAAAVTLGTGNSLGPEGPSVEIGASIATGVSTALNNSRERRLATIAAGSAAGISSGFNAAVAGCFFAVESVLRTSAFSTGSLTTAMILLGSVLASVVSQAGLGSDPAFRVPQYDLRSPAELPLYLLLGLFCGGVSIALSRGSVLATQAFDQLKKRTGMHPALMPAIGGLSVGIIALAYPEILYWGWTNVDVLLESRPSNDALPTVLLLQLVGVKILATSLCRGSGLVGGVYAPSLFIGAALGAAYGRLAGEALAWAEPTYNITGLAVAAPQAYAMVGMAATLAGVCQVPLTSVLLLFELTRDYRIILPLMGAVGLSAWLASTANKKPKKVLPPVAAAAAAAAAPARPALGPGGTSNEEVLAQSQSVGEGGQVALPALRVGSQSGEGQVAEAGSGPAGGGSVKIFSSTGGLVLGQVVAGRGQGESQEGEGEGVCLLDSSLCVGDAIREEEELLPEIAVQTAMRTRFAAVEETATVRDAMAEMARKKEWCCLVLGNNRVLKGLLTLADIQQEVARLSNKTSNTATIDIRTQEVGVLCRRRANRGDLQLATVQADATLETAQRMMTPRGLRQLPVLAATDGEGGTGGHVIGVVDREGISLACRAEATRRLLASLPRRSSLDLVEANGFTRSQSA